MKYQTNAVGHRVGASELPTRHPRHKPRRHFPPLILPRSSKLLQDISLFLLLSLSFFFFYRRYPHISPFSPPLLFVVVFFFNVLHLFAASIYIFLFPIFLFLVP